MANWSKPLHQAAQDLHQQGNTRTSVRAWHCLKVTAGKDGKLGDFKMLVDWLLDDYTDDGDTIALKFRIIAEIALARAMGAVTPQTCPTLHQISNPFVIPGSLAAILDGSFVHEILKTSDRITKALRRLLKLGIHARGVEAAMVLVIVFMRSQKLAKFLVSQARSVGRSFNGQHLQAALSLFKSKYNPQMDRFLPTRFISQGIPQRYCLDLQHYRLCDVLGAVSCFLHASSVATTRFTSWFPSEADIHDLLKSTAFRDGYVLMSPASWPPGYTDVSAHPRKDHSAQIRL